MKNILGEALHRARKNSRAVQIVLSALILAGGIFVTEYVVVQATGRAVQEQRVRTVERLATLRARLEGEINATLHLARGLIGYTATHPNLDWDEFELLAAEIIAIGKHVRNIGLAPKNVLRFVYPRAGNERAIGLVYEENPTQWPAVKRAIDLGSTIVAGPVKLVQGGTAFISRTPIYVRDRKEMSAGSLEYWGIASVVIEMPSLFAAADITGERGTLRLAIRGTDGLGPRGDVFFGEPDLFSEDVVVQDVSLPNGTWRIAAIPTEGWKAPAGELITIRLGGISAAIVITGLVFLLLDAYRRNREMALKDPLTGLPNRRLLLERLEQMIALSDRNNGGFTILYVDLNDFKPINDRYGHPTGDAVLVEIGKRLGTCTRRTDTVARVGGDEFVVVLAAATEEDTVQEMARKLHSVVAMPIHLKEKELTLTASVGTATYPTDADSAHTLLARADQEMYSAKPTPVARMVPASS